MPVNGGSVRFSTFGIVIDGPDFQLGVDDGRVGTGGQNRALVHGGHPGTKNQLLVNFFDGPANAPDFRDGVVLGGPAYIIASQTPTIAGINIAGDPLPLTVNGDLVVTGTLTINGALIVNGLTVKGPLNVSGRTTFDGDVVCNGGVFMNLPNETAGTPNKDVLIETQTNRLVRDV